MFLVGHATPNVGEGVFDCTYFPSVVEFPRSTDSSTPSPPSRLESDREMSTDKSWMAVKNRLSREYINGVKEFVEVAKARVNADGHIRCPCMNCLNRKFQTLIVVQMHLIQKGIQPSYTVWSFRGESFHNPPVDYPEDDSDEMADVLADLAGHGGYGETNNTSGGSFNEHPTYDNNRQDKFDDLFKEMEIELYPGCQKFSALNFLVKLMHLKVLNKWSNKYFDMLLKLLNKALPTGTILPSSHYESNTKLSNLGLGYESIHVCKYDCALFWKEHAKLQNCPVCGESRWVDKNAKGKRVPNKVMRYFPLTPRLKRLYSSRYSAKYMRWHYSERPTEDGVLRHPADSQAWKEFDQKYPLFAARPRNVILGLATDGFNLFGNMSNAYNMWPVIIVPYNLLP